MNKNIWLIMASGLLVSFCIIFFLTYLQRNRQNNIENSDNAIIARLSQIDQKINEIDSKIKWDKILKWKSSEKITKAEDWYKIRVTNPKPHQKGELFTNGEFYKFNSGKIIWIKDYESDIDVCAYYKYDEELPEVVKYDIRKDGTFDIIEYHIDGRDFGKIDSNQNGKFEDNEVYIGIEKKGEHWKWNWEPLFPTTLPIPIFPGFPY